MTDSPLIRTVITTPDGVIDSIAIPPNGPVWTYADVDGDRAAVFGASIPDVGPGVYLRTCAQGCSVAAADVEVFIDAIRTALASAQGSPTGATTPSPDANTNAVAAIHRTAQLIREDASRDEVESALALANWLDATAREYADNPLRHDCRHALNVARAFLGEVEG